MMLVLDSFKDGVTKKTFGRDTVASSGLSGGQTVATIALTQVGLGHFS